MITPPEIAGKITYQAAGDWLWYLLNQKLADNVEAQEVLKSVKDSCGLKAWRLLCKENEKMTSMDFLAEQTRLMEPEQVKEVEQIPAAIRVWENALVDLKERGARSMISRPTSGGTFL